MFYIHRLIFYTTYATAAKDGRDLYYVFLYRANLDGTNITLLDSNFDSTTLEIDNRNIVCWVRTGK